MTGTSTTCSLSTNQEVQSVAQALSVGVATLAASMAKPRLCAYSRNVSLNRGAVFSASVTIGDMLSGITTGKTPAKKPHAASKPRITSSVVWAKLGHTNMWRLKQAVKMRAWHTRRLSPSGTRPRRPKSTCSSIPGGGSSTRTVVLRRPAPQRSTAKRARVRCGTSTPRRASRIPIFTTVRSSSTHFLMRASSASSRRHASPWPSVRTGRTSSTTRPISSSVSCSSPPDRSSPRRSPAAM